MYWEIQNENLKAKKNTQIWWEIQNDKNTQI